ncbi:Dinitrogenase iron-molybdenum cofactor [Alteromonadaceae bacterium Bs31]|nr:Dinitrogenase iron-molybdenum cofactor [Alteromonadaceae bacterium Bs31]
MKTQALNDEVALRIGLAVKELQGVNTSDLLKLLITIMGEPITQSKLARLRAKKVRSLGEDVFKGIDASQFEKAFALLKGRGIRQYLHPKPEFESGVFCEISGSLRVACASDRGESIDGSFAECVRFLIYQVSPDYLRLIDIREPSQKIARAERNQARASLLQDCALVYSTGIGAAAAAKAIKAGVQPITLSAANAQDALSKLQEVLAQINPPPWLVKAMGKPSLGVKLYGEV